MKEKNKTKRYIDALELKSIYISERSASSNSNEILINPFSQLDDKKKESEQKKKSTHNIKREIKQLLSC